ncbi:hypothetical protein [Agromyces sp. NPDC049794]|uniref:hypothetical protein n=1 Tax=unclassified Agromyces TaxID=2639701 RepID=UPI0033C292E5
MAFVLFVWMEEIGVTAIALVTVGLLLHSARKSVTTAPSQSWAGRLAAAIASAGVVLYWLSRWWSDYADPRVERFAIPMAAAIVAVVAYIAFSARRPAGRQLREVDLTPRSLWSFGSSSWFTLWAVLTGLLAMTVVLAGLASSTDDSGRHIMILIQIGGSQAGTIFFGWSFGLPVLVTLVALNGVVMIALWRIARPAVPADPVLRDNDRAARRNQSRTVLSITSGAMAFTLGASWLFIGRSAQLAASLPGPDGIRIELGTSFAALAMPLTALGLLLEGAGVALVLFPLCQRAGRLSTKQPAHESAEARAGR